MVTHHCDHLIIPAIYLKLKAHDILADLPAILNPSVPERVLPEQRSGSKEAVEGNREHNQQILQQIDDITAVLNKENIQLVFLKGIQEGNFKAMINKHIQ